MTDVLPRLDNEDIADVLILARKLGIKVSRSLGQSMPLLARRERHRLCHALRYEAEWDYGRIAAAVGFRSHTGARYAVQAYEQEQGT